uniref:Small ribosomal subunit protein uS3m n=1 Tax=Geranium endressii TaxID=379948 RepID=A0A0G3B9F0_9ROSI|nr:ribosomal protein S3 [Geranium endressii]
MARKGNPISTRLNLNRSSDSAWFTDLYYTDFVSQDVNLRSYFDSVHCPKTKKKNWGFRLGRSFLFHFPKRTLIHFFFPRLNQRIKTRVEKQKEKNRFKIKVKRDSGQRRKKANQEEGIMDTLSNLRKFFKKLDQDQSPSIKRKTILSKLLEVGAFPKYAEKKKNINRLELLKKKDSLNFLVMQYFFLNAKNKIKLNPVLVINHLVARDVSELSTQLKKSRSASFKRIRSRIAFFVENLTSEKGSFSEAKKELTRLIVQANDLRFARTTKTTISLFPFFGAPFFFLMNELGLGGVRRRIPYGYNRYLNAVKSMEDLLSNRTNSNTLIMKSVKIRSIYQSASMIAQEISLRLKKLKKRSFRKTYTHFAHNIPIVMKKRVLGIRISCSGRLKGKPIASTFCGKYGKTSGNVFNQKIDYAFRKVSTRYGILGVKVWISYTNKKENTNKKQKSIKIERWKIHSKWRCCWNPQLQPRVNHPSKSLWRPLIRSLKGGGKKKVPAR